jgi:hypothetical protein
MATNKWKVLPGGHLKKRRDRENRCYCCGYRCRGKGNKWYKKWRNRRLRFVVSKLLRKFDGETTIFPSKPGQVRNYLA